MSDCLGTMRRCRSCAAERSTSDEASTLAHSEVEFEAMVATGDPQRMALADKAFHCAVHVVGAGRPSAGRRPAPDARFGLQERLPGVARELIQAHLVESRIGAERAAQVAAQSGPRSEPGDR